MAEVGSGACILNRNVSKGELGRIRPRAAITGSPHVRKIDRQTGQESRFRVLQLAALSAAIALLIWLANSTIVGQQNRTWSHVQTTARNSGADSNSLAFASATQARNVIIAEVDWSDGSDFVSISDSQATSILKSALSNILPV